MLKGDVFEHQYFEHQIFAMFIHLFTNKANGIAKSYKNAMKVSYSGHTVTIDSGACLVQGRFLEEDNSTTIDAGIETSYCKLVVEIDLDKTNTEEEFNQGVYKIVKGTTAYPSLEQDDTVGKNAGKYQYELARFRISDGAITGFEDKRTYIEDQLAYTGINQLENSKAPTSHASAATTYGVGTTSNYGHCKIINDLTKTAYANGEVLGAYQGKVLNDKISSLNSQKAAQSHASTATTYGVGTESNYGHCKTINNLNKSSFVNGEALSAKQGYDLNTKINGKAPTSHASTATTYGVGTTSNYGHCKTINDLTKSSYANGEALAAYQGYQLNQKKLDKAGGTLTGQVNTQNLVPTSSGNYNLGSSTYRYKNGYLTFLKVYDSAEIDGPVTVGRYLYVNKGNIQSEYTYNNDTVSSSTNMYITPNGWIRRTTNTSSKRYKKNITEKLNDELNPQKLYDLKVKQFKYKEEYQPNEKDSRYGKDLIGFVAEDVEEIYPVAVDYEDGKVDNWNERYMIPAMLKLIQEQNERIKVLEEKVGVVHD